MGPLSAGGFVAPAGTIIGRNAKALRDSGEKREKGAKTDSGERANIESGRSWVIAEGGTAGGLEGDGRG